MTDLEQIKLGEFYDFMFENHFEHLEKICKIKQCVLAKEMPAFEECLKLLDELWENIFSNYPFSITKYEPNQFEKALPATNCGMYFILTKLSLAVGLMEILEIEKNICILKLGITKLKKELE